MANYAPVGESELASAAIVLIPIALLFVLIFTTRVIYAAAVSLLIFLIVAIAAYHMPAGMAFMSALNGFLYGAWPICIIVFAAIFTYDLCTISGHMETVKFSIISLTNDKRLLALLLAYAFSGFIEGASGFGTPVALAAAMLIGVGFYKQESAALALLGNTIPVPFGGLGIPIIGGFSGINIPVSLLGKAVVRLLLPFSFAMPWLIVLSVSSVKDTLEVWPACLLTSVVSVSAQLAIAEFATGAVSILSMIITLACLGVLCKFWRPKNILQTESMAAEEVGLKHADEVHAIAHQGSSKIRRGGLIAISDGEAKADVEPTFANRDGRSSSVTTNGLLGGLNLKRMKKTSSLQDIVNTGTIDASDCKACDSSSGSVTAVELNASPPAAAAFAPFNSIVAPDISGSSSATITPVVLTPGGAPPTVVTSDVSVVGGVPSHPDDVPSSSPVVTSSQRSTPRNSDRTLTRHLSMRIDKSHPLRPELTPKHASVRRQDFADRRAIGSSKSTADAVSGASIFSAAAVESACGAPLPADAAAPPGGEGHVFIMRRFLPRASMLRELDSSHVGTALFPHTVEYELGLRHRTQGPFVRVTRERGGTGLTSAAVPAPSAAAPPVSTGQPPAAQGITGSGVTSASASFSATGAVAPSAPVSGNSTSRSAGEDGDENKPHYEPTIARQPSFGGAVRDVWHLRTGKPQPSAAEAGTSQAASSSTTTAPTASVAGSDLQHPATTDEPHHHHDDEIPHYDALHPPTGRETLIAWFPWALISVAVCIWGMPAIKGSALTEPRTGLSVATVLVPMSGLDGQVFKPDPTDPLNPDKYKQVRAVWSLDILAAIGMCILLCALCSSLVFGLPPKRTAWIMWRSFRRMALSMLTICTLLALGFVMKMSGMDTTLGLAAAKSGRGYPFIGPWIGFLGVVITGSSTSSNVLFGSLQVVAAQAIGVNPVQMAASNVAGGCLGPSVSSMVVAAVATGSDSRKIGPIAKRVILYRLPLITALALWNILVINAFPGYIPSYDVASSGGG